MDATGGHSVILGMQNQVGRKEWRAVTEGSARERLPGDGSGEHSRVNGSARMRPSPGPYPENSRNGRIFHSGGSSSSSSSDSDHHAGDSKHTSVPSQDIGRQNGEDAKLYDEEQDPVSNGHMSSPSNGLPLDDGGLNSSKHFNETLEQRLHDVIRQREQLQRMEAELRAQFIARSEILRMQNNFDEQTKQHASIVSNLQEKLQEKEHRLHEMEQQLEERERQLHANQREASEAVNQVWAKDGLLREQTSELATLRRERENILAEQEATLSQFEAERAQILSQLQDLEEQVQEKERQLQEIDEQRRTAQETLLYKDDQLREAQAWIQRAQELDTFHANTNSSLHAELRDRTEQMNQLWLGQQRQLAEVERYHLQTIQRLRMDVAEAREQNRVLKSGSNDNAEAKSEQSGLVNNKHTEHFNVTDPSVGNVGKLKQGMATASNQVEHGTGLPVPASPVLGGTAPVVPASPIPVLHQFAGQPQGMVSSVPAAPSQITQYSLSQFSNPVIIQTQQQLPVVHQQAMQQQSKQAQQPQPSQVRLPHPQQLQVYSHFPETKSPISLHMRGINHQQQQLGQQGRDQMVLDQGGPKNAIDFSHLTNVPVTQHINIQLPVQELEAGQHILHQDSIQFSEQQVGQPLQGKHVQEEKQEIYAPTLSQQESKEQQLQPQQDEKARHFHEQNGEVDCQSMEATDQMQSFSQQPILHHVQPQLPKDSNLTGNSEHHNMNQSNTEEQQLAGSLLSAAHLIANLEAHSKHGPSSQNVPTGVASAVQQVTTSEGNGKAAEPTLLDEKSLLACLVRAIPSEASARIKISTTLPNRLGKMLAPLHWHDYKKQYGRLDEFISSHPKLFVIDGDFVHLREGAHAIISATTAVAKVAAAAAAPSSLGTNWPPTVAVTPVAHSQVQRVRKITAPVHMGAKEGPQSAGIHYKQEGLFSQLRINGSRRLSQGFIGKDVVGESAASQHQPGILSFSGVANSDGQRVVSVLGSRIDGLPLSASNANALEFEKFSSGAYGASATATRKNVIIYGGRQVARTSVMETEPFVKKEFTGLSQTQENRISRAS